MPEQTRDSMPPGRRTRPGSGLARCGLGIRGPLRRPFPGAAGRCPLGPDQAIAPQPDHRDRSRLDPDELA
ncbi:hypothetical protein [Nocardia asteroides]|uniref:hypothetical protein n=1 Tax=Nocardia asteroides TaxID=1824 RepID=UPI003668FCFB